MQRRNPPSGRAFSAVIAWAVVVAAFVVELTHLDGDLSRWLRPGRHRVRLYVTGGLVCVCALLWFVGAWRRVAAHTSFGLRPSARDPGRYVETFAVFMGLTSLGTRGARMFLPSGWPSVFFYGAPFVALLWLLVRGCGVRAAAADLGFRSRGPVWKEVVVGLAGGLAVWVLAGAVFEVLATVAGAEADSDFVGSSMRAKVSAAIARTLLWAPLIEETMFRGALYRGIRGRMGWFASGALVALLFALAHPLWPVWPIHFAAGVGYALLREWRGSLIGPVVAHTTYNAIVAFPLFTVWVKDLL